MDSNHTRNQDNPIWSEKTPSGWRNLFSALIGYGEERGEGLTLCWRLGDTGVRDVSLHYELN